MDRFKRNDDKSLRGPAARRVRRLGLAAGLLVVLSLLVAACGAAVEPVAVLTAEPTESSVTEPTALPVVEPTALPVVEPTALPVAEPAVEPTAEPTALSAPTDAPAANAGILPSVTVANQPIVDGKVTIGEVVSSGPGWITVHADQEGKPGPILGFSPVADGANTNVPVKINLTAATGTLYAMLHTDGGTVGTWEFPGGPDTPVTVAGQVVTPAFQLAALAGDEGEVEIEDFKFNPGVLVIRTGTTVKFANKDDVQHTATSDTGVWDSGYLSKGEEFFFTFTEPGVYPYYCIPHGGPGGQGMSATIIVLR